MKHICHKSLVLSELIKGQELLNNGSFKTASNAFVEKYT